MVILLFVLYYNFVHVGHSDAEYLLGVEAQKFSKIINEVYFLILITKYYQ